MTDAPEHAPDPLVATALDAAITAALKVTLGNGGAPRIQTVIENAVRAYCDHPDVRAAKIVVEGGNVQNPGSIGASD